MQGFADPNAAVRANSMFLVGVAEGAMFRPGVSFIVYGDFLSLDSTREFGRQVKRLFDSARAPAPGPARRRARPARSPPRVCLPAMLTPSSCPSRFPR